MLMGVEDGAVGFEVVVQAGVGIALAGLPPQLESWLPSP
jgi:hypothetical protein